jgi:biopolymer transport protein ExbD
VRIGRRPSRRRVDRITLNLASMIDVTFLLLVYFMVATVLSAPEDKLSPTLQARQEESSGAASDFQPQVIEVLRLADGPAWRLGTVVIRERAVLLEALRRLPSDPGVFVQVYGGVDVEMAVAAVQAARDAGFDEVTYVPAD